MDSMELKEMNFEELRNLIEAANKEMKIRWQHRREGAWKAVEQAISNYTREFGYITVDNGESEISDDCNFAHIGVILTYKTEEEEEEW